MKMIIAYLIFIVFTALVLGFSLRERGIPAFTDDNCIRAIVGEYSVKNDYYGMKLIAHAIRNRKTLRGVYGFYAKHADRESKDIWESASLAWFDSLNEFDPLRGATAWLSSDDLKTHRQPRGMGLVKIYNGIFFYKKVTR